MTVTVGFGIDWCEIWMGISWHHCDEGGFHVTIGVLPCLMIHFSFHP